MSSYSSGQNDGFDSDCCFDHLFEGKMRTGLRAADAQLDAFATHEFGQNTILGQGSAFQPGEDSYENAAINQV